MIAWAVLQESSACAWWIWTEQELQKSVATPFK